VILMRPRSSGVMSMVSRAVRRVCDRGPSSRDPHDFSGGRGSHKSDTRIDAAAQLLPVVFGERLNPFTDDQDARPTSIEPETSEEFWVEDVRHFEKLQHLVRRPFAE